MAEGAIEGAAAMYELPSPYATGFAFSRFDAVEVRAIHVDKWGEGMLGGW